MNDGNMMISICENEIIGEPVIFTTEEAFAPGITYYIEYDAKSALEYPLRGTVIPFQISNGGF